MLLRMSCDECLLVEILTINRLNSLAGNHYFPPDTKAEVITE
jgi:hypothetical protein